MNEPEVHHLKTLKKPFKKNTKTIGSPLVQCWSSLVHHGSTSPWSLVQPQRTGDHRPPPAALLPLGTCRRPGDMPTMVEIMG